MSTKLISFMVGFWAVGMWVFATGCGGDGSSAATDSATPTGATTDPGCTTFPDCVPSIRAGQPADQHLGSGFFVSLLNRNAGSGAAGQCSTDSTTGQLSGSLGANVPGYTVPSGICVRMVTWTSAAADGSTVRRLYAESVVRFYIGSGTSGTLYKGLYAFAGSIAANGGITFGYELWQFPGNNIFAPPTLVTTAGRNGINQIVESPSTQGSLSISP